VETVLTLLAAICLTPNAALGDGGKSLPNPHVTNPCDPLEGDCDPSPPGDPTQYLDPLGIAVSVMHTDLIDNWFQSGVCATVEYADPEVITNGDILSASGTFSRLDPGDGEIIPPHFDPGTIDITTNLNGPGADVEIVLDDQSGPDGGFSKRWTLTLTVSVSQGTVYLWGTLDYIRFIPLETATYTGGWTYSPTTGPLDNPASDSGFHTEMANMFGCETPVAGANSIGSILGIVGNGIGMWLNYLRDLFRPYSPPSNCLGPSISNGSGQSCDGVDIPCAGDLAEVSTYLDDLTGVSSAFKKCLKGRLGCGGSSFPRLRISCDSPTSCGGCGSPPPGIIYGGCNLGGTALWYCHNANTNECGCVNTIFHEASHSCGALDLETGAANDSYRIGDWFEDEFQDQNGLDAQCLPSSSMGPWNPGDPHEGDQ